MSVPQSVGKEVAAIVKERVGFTIPWELIIPLVEWLIEECFPTSESLVCAARSPSVFQMVVLRLRCRLQLRGRFRGRELRQATNALADAVLEVGTTLPEDDLAAMVE